MKATDPVSETLVFWTTSKIMFIVKQRRQKRGDVKGDSREMHRVTREKWKWRGGR